MTNRRKIFLKNLCFLTPLLLLTGGAVIPQNAPAGEAFAAGVIPRPVDVISEGNLFVLDPGDGIYYADEELTEIAGYLAEKFRPSTGYALPVTRLDSPPGRGIFLTLGGNELLGNEGYRIYVTTELITVEAPAPCGVFRGIQTLRQLFPAKIEESVLQEGPWVIGTGAVQDYPRYGYRGAMLDVARHFFSVDQVKTHLDRLAYYKINFLHLHLTDDQGWRIEIESRPNLTRIGAKSGAGGGPGGFYTKEDYREIVAYASARYITIVPEIEMPGHVQAALVSCPELNGDKPRPKPYMGKGVPFSCLNVDLPATYTFLEDVIREIAAITPGPYIHIGGDEVNKLTARQYKAFINRVQGLVEKAQKKLIGWEDIAVADLKPDYLIQHWKTTPLAAGLKQRVIVSPADKAYLDMKYHEKSRIGATWAGYTEVDEAYNWDPADEVPAGTDIIGIECPLWTETVKNMKDIEYLTFPRLPGYAEIGWSRPPRNWAEYRTRLALHGPRMKALGIDFYPSPTVDWP